MSLLTELFFFVETAFYKHDAPLASITVDLPPGGKDLPERRGAL
jgi:hypothetical protein